MNSSWCIYESEACDGIANCPYGDDEKLEDCEESGKFSDLATVTCLARDIFNSNITIKAVKCDNVIECKSGEDESFCSIPEYISLISLIVIFMATCTLTLLLWKFIVRSLEISHPPLFISQEELKLLHQTYKLKEVMHEAQKSEKSKSINDSYVQMEIKTHDGLSSETLCCIKNSLDPFTAAKVLNDCPLEDEPESFVQKVVNKLKASSLMRDHRSQKILKHISALKIIIAPASHLLDLTKDVLILVEVTLSQGGFVLLVAQPKPYIKGVRHDTFHTNISFVSDTNVPDILLVVGFNHHSVLTEQFPDFDQRSDNLWTTRMVLLVAYGSLGTVLSNATFY